MKKSYVFAKIIEHISTVLAIIGIVSYFKFNYIYFYNEALTITVLCGIFNVIKAFINCAFGGQTNLNTEIFTIIIGFVVGSIYNIPLLPAISLALCIGEVVFSIIGFISYLFIWKKLSKKEIPQETTTQKENYNNKKIFKIIIAYLLSAFIFLFIFLLCNAITNYFCFADSLIIYLLEFSISYATALYLFLYIYTI